MKKLRICVTDGFASLEFVPSTWQLICMQREREVGKCELKNKLTETEFWIWWIQTRVWFWFGFGFVVLWNMKVVGLSLCYCNCN